MFFFFFSSRRRHTRYWRDWSSDVCSSDLEDLGKYVDLARRLGFAADSVWEVGTEVVSEAAVLCEQVAKLYPKATIFTGKLVFRRERFFHGLLHNETSKIIQRRL